MANNNDDGKYFNMNTVFSLKSEDNNHSLNMGAYAGKMSFSIFTGQGSGTPPLKISISSDAYIVLSTLLKQVRKEAPGAKHSFRISSFDSVNKKKILKQVLTFGINENGVFYIDIQDVISGLSAKFPFKGTGYIEIGTEQNTVSSRSKVNFDAFCMWFNLWPQVTLLTKNRPSTNSYNGNGNTTTTNVTVPSSDFNKGSDNELSDDTY